MASDDQLVSNLATSFGDLESAMQKAVARMESATQKMDKLAASTRKVGAATAGVKSMDVTKGLEASTRAAQGLSYQLNDISTSLAGGMSPFQIMMQQGSQVAMVFEDLKRQGGSAGGALAGAMRSMLGPTQLVTFALIALSGYAAQWAMKAISGTEEVDTTTLDLLSSVDKLTKEYSGQLGPKGTKALDDIAAAAKRALAAQDMKKVADALVSELDGAMGELTGTFSEMSAMMRDMLPPDQRQKLADFQDGFHAIAKAAAEGGDVIGAVTKHVAELDAIVRKYDGSLLAELALRQKEALTILLPKLTETADATGGLAAAQRTLADGAGGLVSAQKRIGEILDEIRKKVVDNRTEYQKLIDLTGEMGQATGQLEERQQYVFDRKANAAALEAIGSDQTLFLQSRAVSEKIRQSVTKLDSQMAEGLAALLKEFPELRIASAYRSYAEQAAIVASGVRPAAAPGKSRHQFGEAADLTTGGMTPERYRELTAAAKEYGLVFPLPGNDPGHVQLIKDEKVALTEAEQAAKQAAEAYSQLTDTQRASISLAEFENSVNADAALSASQKIALIEREKVLRDLNAAATLTGNQLTADEIALNTQLADAAGKQAQAKYEIAAANQAAAKSSKELTASQQQTATVLNTLEASLGSGLSQFAIDLKNGEDAGESFRRMINSLIDDMIRMAIQAMVLKPLFDALRGAAGLPTGVGASGAKAGGIVGFTGGAKQSVGAGTFAGAPRYASGGMVGYDPNAVPIIAHRGEVIIPRSAMNRAAFQTRQAQGENVRIDGRSNIKVEVSNGGGTSATQASSVAFGQLIDRTMQAVIVRESRPGGLLRQQGAR